MLYEQINRNSSDCYGTDCVIQGPITTDTDGTWAWGAYVTWSGGCVSGDCGSITSSKGHTITWEMTNDYCRYKGCGLRTGRFFEWSCPK